MEETLPEQFINISPEPVSLKATENIFEQMKKYVCKIYNKKEGTGFFIKLPFNDKELTVLITNNHIIGLDDIKEGKTITIFVGDGSRPRNIKIKDRITFTNERLDVTIIEIKKEKDQINYFLELDDEIKYCLHINNEEILDYLKNMYSNKSLYTMGYGNDKNVYVSYGKPANYLEDYFKHFCSTKEGGSGSPIFLLNTQKIIGYHTGKSNLNNYNVGYLIIYAIIEFNKLNNHSEIKNQPENIQLNEMKIKYKINSKKKIKLFGKKFVENNQKNCKIIINDKELELCEYLDIDQNLQKNEILEITLKEINTVTDFSYMFEGNFYDDYCDLLDSSSIINKWNTQNVNNLSGMFQSCFSLKDLPDISSFDTSNVNNMSNMFSGCSSLTYLPDISKWDTSNVLDMSFIFSSCCSLASLPDISKWVTQNVNNLSGMFQVCSSLESLPDISKWETKNVNNMSWIFSQCSELKALPDISKWNTENVLDMKLMFNQCNSLEYLPDISKWKTQKVINMSGMFQSCQSLHSLPDISNWDTKNVTDLSFMFSHCLSLTSLPNISRWDIRNARNRKAMFINCNKNLHIPPRFQLI